MLSPPNAAGPGAHPGIATPTGVPIGPFDGLDCPFRAYGGPSPEDGSSPDLRPAQKVGWFLEGRGGGREGLYHDPPGPSCVPRVVGIPSGGSLFQTLPA